MRKNSGTELLPGGWRAEGGRIGGGEECDRKRQA